MLPKSRGPFAYACLGRGPLAYACIGGVCVPMQTGAHGLGVEAHLSMRA
jgi:hypothetical protein